MRLIVLSIIKQNLVSEKTTIMLPGQRATGQTKNLILARSFKKKETGWHVTQIWMFSQNVYKFKFKCL